METKINVAEILKDKPQGTKLYADAFGELEYCGISNDKDPRIFVEAKECTSYSFYNNGKYNKYGEPILFPSKEMRDWRKFAWKKGDVLVNSRGLKILFDRWANENYTSFYAKTINLVEDGFLDTNLHTLASEKEAKSFIKCIEERFGGKLNLQTLEIQKAQPEFKDGDFVTVAFTDGDEMICVFKEKIEQDYMGYCGFFSKGKHEGDVSMDLGDDCICNDSPICKEIRLATEEEKQQLFSALAKEGKAWDAEKKQIVDLEPKIELRPFDRVLVRNRNTHHWEADLFGFKSDGANILYHCVGGFWKICIPYEGNEHLLGTTKDVEG